MAEKRMFSKKVTDSDAFIELSSSAQALYFHLSQGADDDGFNNQIQLAMLKAHSTIDDLKVLILKNFIIKFDSGVIVIRHWRLNNYLQKDRVKPTIHQEELASLLVDKSNVYNLYTSCIQSIDKNSIVENSIDNNICCSNTIYNYIEENFGRTLSPIEYEKISLWEDNELTRYAIKQAVLNGKYNIRYIEVILNNYAKNNITSVQQAQEQEKNFKNKTNKYNAKEDMELPSWFNKEQNKEEKASQEDIEGWDDFVGGLNG